MLRRCIPGYYSWRQLGDVIGTLFALGYHEEVNNDGQASLFQRDLGRAALSRTYSADKNLAIFLGRPPRLRFRYCQRQLPIYHGKQNWIAEDRPSASQTTWPPSESFDYIADTRWSAVCATMKEQILDLSQEKDVDKRLSRAK